MFLNFIPIEKNEYEQSFNFNNMLPKLLGITLMPKMKNKQWPRNETRKSNFLNQKNYLRFHFLLWSNSKLYLDIFLIYVK
jgi:hypothetical protein